MSFIERVLSIKGYLFSLLLAILTYLFYILIINNGQEYYTVPLEVRYPTLLATSSTVTNTINVIVRGNPATLARVSKDDMLAYVDLKNISKPGQIKQEILLQRSGVLADIDNVEINLDPSVIDINLETRVVKEVVLEPTYINSLSRGYLIRGSVITPSVAEISGPESVVKKIEKITTEEIDLSLLTKPVSRTVGLKEPEYIEFRNLKLDDIKVYTIVEPVIEVKTYNRIQVKVVGEKEDFEITDNLETVTIVVQGPQLSIEKFILDPYIDIQGVNRPGNFKADVRLEVTGNIEVISIDPPQLDVSLARLSSVNSVVAPSNRPSNIISEEDVPESTPAPLSSRNAIIEDESLEPVQAPVIQDSAIIENNN